MQRLNSVCGYATVLDVETLFMDFFTMVLLLRPFSSLSFP